MTDTRVTRVVIEFHTYSIEEHQEKAERIANFADHVMCGGECDANTCVPFSDAERVRHIAPLGRAQ